MAGRTDPRRLPCVARAVRNPPPPPHRRNPHPHRRPAGHRRGWCSHRSWLYRKAACLPLEPVVIDETALDTVFAHRAAEVVHLGLDDARIGDVHRLEVGHHPVVNVLLLGQGKNRRADRTHAGNLHADLAESVDVPVDGGTEIAMLFALGAFGTQIAKVEKGIADLREVALDHGRQHVEEHDLSLGAGLQGIQGPRPPQEQLDFRFGRGLNAAELVRDALDLGNEENHLGVGQLDTMNQDEVVAGHHPAAVDAHDGPDPGLEGRQQESVVLGALLTGVIPHDAAQLPAVEGPSQDLVHADARRAHGADGGSQAHMPAFMIVKLDFEPARVPQEFFEDMGKMGDDQRSFTGSTNHGFIDGLHLGIEVDRDADANATAPRPVEVEAVHVQHRRMQASRHLDLDEIVFDLVVCPGFKPDGGIVVDKAFIAGLE
ncbi:hypothetical protein DESC_770047 [Desulfosarcina cetonica]|nr:hypothetical protein DESC_770047 [Desulfosarcina cetonica]